MVGSRVNALMCLTFLMTVPLFARSYYDSIDRVEKMVNARGAVTKFTYTPTGKIATVTDALLGVVSYEYQHTPLKITK